MDSKSSPNFDEANLCGLFSEGLSAEHDTVLADEADGVSGHAAGAGVLSVLSLMGTKLMRHFLNRGSSGEGLLDY